jgi:hypothetical protein
VKWYPSFAPKLRKLVFHVANFASEQQLYGVLYRVDDGEWLNLKQGEDIEMLEVDAGGTVRNKSNDSRWQNKPH